MKRGWFLPIGLLVLGAAGLIGQTGREAYRTAYDTWRQTHADLESAAGTGGTTLVSQMDRAAAAAASFQATRAGYLKSVAQDAAQRRRLLQTAAARPSPDLAPPAAAQLVAGELQTVTKAIATFANDRDRGIQQLRQSLERERIALAALNESIQARQKAVTATSEISASVEQSRARTAEAFDDQTSRLSQAVEQLAKEGAAWADYYEKLVQAIQVANAPPPPPVSVTPAAPKSTSLPSVPLVRYVGTWTYPIVNGIFHGTQPEFVDLVVHEQNGHADGTLYGRFKVPPGSTIDPLLRFDFEGDFGPTTTQKFTLMTSDQARGTIELIPGPAFNLLEVNFQADAPANKIRVGNFILVKK